MVDRPQGDLSPAGLTRRDFLKVSGAVGFLATASGSAIALLGDEVAVAQQSSLGSFSKTFVEPVIYLPESHGGGKVRSRRKCIERDGEFFCKPTAGTIAVLPDGRFLYWNALEGTENSQLFVGNMGDEEVDDDQSRVLTLSSNDQPSWLKPVRSTGAAEGEPISPLLKPLVIADRKGNNGSLFCTHQAHLPDGSILAVGGTIYYQEPWIELEGTKAARIFDPESDGWFLTGYMNHGRWYPASVPLSNGDIFVCGGVRKLEKPVYPDDPFGSGDNVRPTETYSLDTGQWTDNGISGERSLPLLPRIHLLPNGHVFYNGAGQAWNPNGQSYRQATWNITASYDPEEQIWSDVGVAGFPFRLDETSLGQIAEELSTTPIGTPVQPTVVNDEDELADALVDVLVGAPQDPTELSNAAGLGSRLSTFEVPLLMEPDESGNYDEVELLAAGGTVGGGAATSPGSYVATHLSRIDKVTTSPSGVKYESRLTGQLNNRRWFSSGVLLPTGEVFCCSGADRDEVVAPGVEAPVKVAELFDPETETWAEVAEANRPRTYHNTAILMPDGRVLVGGHAPIPTGYVSHMTPEDSNLGPNDGRDPTFEIYSPPYISGARPTIQNRTDAPREIELGSSFNIATGEAGDVDSVVLMRVPSVTHVNDTEQRGVKLNFERSGNTLKAQMPSQPAVAPPGHYWVFIVSGGVPSVSQPIQIPMSR